MRRHFTRLALALEDDEVVAGIGRARQTEHLSRHRRARFFDRLPEFIEHCADAAKLFAREHDVTDLQATLLDQHRGHRTAALLEARLDHDTSRRTDRHGLSSRTSDCSTKRFEQRIYAGAGVRGDVDKDRVAAPGLRDHLVLGEFVPHPVRVGRGLVDLVDRHHQRYAGCLGMLDRFDGLRHDAVVCRHHQDHDVRDLGAARAHRGKGRVAGRVEECDLALVHFHHVGADMLGNATGLAVGDMGRADVVEQGRLAVIDMTHDRDHRRPRQWLTLGLGGLCHHVLELIFFEQFDLVAHLFDHDLRRILVDDLIDRGHHTHTHHRLDNFAGLDRHLLCQFGHGDGLGQRDLAHHRRSGTFERVLAVHGNRDRAPVGRPFAPAAGLGAGSDVQFLTAIAGGWCLVRLLGALVLRPLAGLRGALGILFELTPGFLLGNLARLGLGLQPILGFLALTICFLELAQAILFRGAFLLLFGLASALLGQTRVLLRLADLVHFFLLLASLLLQHIALDVSALLAHLDVDRARTPLVGALTQLALRLALERDLARRGAFTLAAVTTAQEGQQLELGVVADPGVRTAHGNPRLFELHQKPLDRHFQNFGKLCDCDVGHR